MIINFEQESKENIKPLDDYDNDFKIRWFNETYQIAKDCFKDCLAKQNEKVYMSIFFDSAMDLLKEKKEFKIYELHSKMGRVFVVSE